MTEKKPRIYGHTRETLADVAREMAKPRLPESVREAIEAEAEATRLRLLRRAHGKRES